MLDIANTLSYYVFSITKYIGVKRWKTGYCSS